MKFVPEIPDPVNNYWEEEQDSQDYQQHGQYSKQHYLSVVGATCSRNCLIGDKIANCKK